MEKPQRRIMTKLAQYWKMVELMRDKPDIAQGSVRRGRAELDAFWFRLSEECNLRGPPYKNPEKWKRTWSDWKLNMKIKLEKCKRQNTLHFLTDMEKEVIRMCRLDNAQPAKTKIQLFFAPEVGIYEAPAKRRRPSPSPPPPPPPPAPTTTTTTTTELNNSVDIEFVSEDENVKAEFLYESDDDNVAPKTFPSKERDKEEHHTVIHPPKKILPVSLELQSQDDPISVTTAHYNEEDVGEEEQEANEIKLLQQQIDIQKKLYKETKEFQMTTSATLQDISLTLNLIKGSVETIEELNVRRLKEHARHNRKIEELLQRLADRDMSIDNRRK